MPLLDLFWTMLWLFLFIMWIWLLISIFGDIFRRNMSGWGKAGWVFFLILLPLFGALIYLIANGGDMHERQASDIKAVEAAQRQYIQEAAGTTSTADEIEKLSKLHKAGTLTDEEFSTQKAKLLA